MIPIVGYEIYHPINNSKLNLSYCNDSIILKVPASVDENKLFRNDPNSNFYKDNCFKYLTENGIDIIIDDRKQEFLEQNLSLCEINCSYIDYDINTKKSYCDCLIKNNMELISEIIDNPNKLSADFSVEEIDTNNLNIKTMKCTKELFSKDGLKNNISSYILLIIILFFLFSIILFIKCGYYFLEEEITNIINLIEKLEKNKNNIAHNNKNSIIKINQNKKRAIKKTNINYPPKKKYNLNLFNNNPKIKNAHNLNLINTNKNQQIRSGGSRIILNKANKKVKKKKKKKKGIIQETRINNGDNNKKIKIEYNIFELNTMDYKEAIINDKRTCGEYYISLLKLKHPILFSFCPIKDYNTMIIKLCISSLSFSIYYTVNFIFYDEKEIHIIYENKGKYDFIHFIPKISFSSIIAHFIFVLIKYIFLSERNLLAHQIADKEKRNLVIKYTLFFILGILFLSFFWMLLSSFGAVCQNSQIIVFENTLICLAISLVYPFIINIVPCGFRVASLSDKNKEKQCIYNFGKFLQLL